MPPKGYSERKKEERIRRSNETLGVILIIASVFALLCLATRGLILGDVGRAISNVVLGFAGYAAYPFFVCLLVLGIVKIRGIKTDVRPAVVTACVFVAIFVITIAHQASSARFFGNGFSAYEGEVYASKNTVGGVLFGLLAYPVHAVFGAVFSYVVYAVAILLSVMFCLPVFGKKKKKSNVKTGFNNKQISSFSPSDDFGSDDFKVGNDGLFVGSIIPSGSDGDSSQTDYDDAPERDEENDPRERLERSYAHEQAKKILLDSDDKYKRDYLASSVSSEPVIKRKESPLPPVDVPAPKSFTANFVPGEIVNGDEESERMSGEMAKKEVPAPPKTQEEEVTGYVKYASLNGNDSEKPEPPKPHPVFKTTGIVNGDYYDGAGDTPTIGLAPMPGEDPKTPVAPVAEARPKDEEKPEPVISVAQTVHAEPVISQPPAEKVTESEERKEEIKPEPVAPRVQPPIINAEALTKDDIDNNVLSRPAAAYYDDDYADGEKTSDDDFGYEKEVDDAKEVSFDDATEEDDAYDSFNDPDETEDNDHVDFNARIDEQLEETGSDAEAGIATDYVTADEETEKAKERSDEFERNTDSFIIDDEVIDESERSFAVDNDTTGYYTHVDNVSTAKAESFSDAVNKVEKKINPRPTPAIKPEPNQINIDSYATQKSQEGTESAPPAQPKRLPQNDKYVAPPIDLLVTESSHAETDDENAQGKIALLEETLSTLNVPAKVTGVTVGPAITRYELDMPIGMSVRKMESLAPDIRYSLASKGQVRIESPIPGKRAVGIEVPNDKIYTVALKDIIGSKEFKDSPSPITVALGKDIQGKVMVTRLEKMPHLLIAGATNSGKSSCLNSLLIGFLFKASPADLRLILIDPKRVEFTAYNGLPHMYIPNAITDVTEAINAFKWAQKEMERRYIELQKNAVRNIQEYNDLVDVKAGKKEKMCYIVIIVDELANLMISVKENQKTLEQLIMDIAAKARAAGIHLVLATQRPSVNVITGTIKANLPSRIAFSVASAQDSRIILDNSGAESLLGRGDMLFAPLDQSEETRIQGAFVENSEVKSIVEYVKEHNSTYFDDDFANAIKAKQKEVVSDDAPASDDDKDGQHDEEFLNVLRCVIKCGAASSSLIQRRFQYGFNKAARMIDRMEEMGFIGPQNNSKPREVYITREKFEEVFGEPYEKKI